MNRAILITAFCVPMALPSPAAADKLQILMDGSYVGYARYEIGSARGRTDRYGRLSLNLPKGTHEGKIEYRGKEYLISVQITGDRQLRKIIIPAK